MVNKSSGYRGGPSALAVLEQKLTGREPDDSDIPGTVRRGVRLMLVGAALTTVIAIFLIVVTVADKSAITGNGKVSTGEFASGVAGAAVTYVIEIAIWVIMARMNRAGRNWARILASVFCLIYTFEVYRLVQSLTGITTVTVVEIVYIVFILAIWIVGALSIAMVWRSESGAYYRARSAPAR